MRARRALVGTAVGVGIVVGGVLLYWPALGWFNRLTKIPGDVKAPYVERLAQSSQEARSQRERLVEAWRAGRDYGLGQTRHTIEATPVEVWLVTSGGKLTLVRDYTRDSYSTRGVYVEHPTSVEFGGERPERDRMTCRLPDGSVETF